MGAGGSSHREPHGTDPRGSDARLAQSVTVEFR
jgi:hypothetical protein